jgi:prophage antirepressor-like protein
MTALTNFTKQEAALWLLNLPGHETAKVELPEKGRLVSALSEAGVYRLMIQSDHPTANPFREWLFREVMPALNVRPDHDTMIWLIDMFGKMLGIGPGAPFDGRDDAFSIAISTSTLTRVVLRSSKPTARHIQDWVCGEVLTSIRRTGEYLDAQRIRAMDAPFSTALRDHADELKTFVSNLTAGDIAEAPMCWRLISEDQLLH